MKIEEAIGRRVCLGSSMEKRVVLNFGVGGNEMKMHSMGDGEEMTFFFITFLGSQNLLALKCTLL